MGDVQPAANSDKPPHPGSAWQQLFDPNTGYPYYWNIHNNQVRWDVPPEFVQYQQRQAQAKKAAEAERNAAKANNNGIAALVSAYSDDSDDDKAVEVVKEKQTVVEIEDEESKPDFIGPVKPSTESDGEKEVQINEEEPAPPGENDEDELTLLRKLQEKSAALAKMGGDISKEVKEIIDPDHLAKIEEDIAADIMSQIEAEEPPDYKAEDEVKNVKEPSPPLPEDPPPLPSDPPPLPSAPLPPGPPEEPTQTSNPISLLSCSYGGESDEDEDEDTSKEELKHTKGKGHLLPAQENLGNIFYKAGAGWGQTEEQKVALESFYVETAIENLKNDKEKPKVEKLEMGRGRKRRLELPTGRFNKLEQGPEEKEQKVVESKFAPMAFVKSNAGLPGTIEDSSKETISDSNDQVIGVIDRGSPSDGCEPAGEPITNGNGRDGDISNMAEELVDKLECFKVGQEKISSLKMLAVKIETLYSAWTAGALTPQYLTAVLNTVASSLTQAEVSLNRPPWTALWDRTAKRYNYRHILTGEVRESSPGPNSDDEEEASSDESPPPLPPAEEDGTPPPPPPQSTSPPPPTRQSTTPTADHQLQDMDIDDDEMTQNPLSSITEEMASFYSDLATLPPTEDSPPAPVPTEPTPPAPAPTPPAPPIIDHLPQLFQDDTGSGSSRSSSPVPLEKMAPAKKRKKPKVSSSLALKKKGVGGMLEKWQNLQS